METLARSRKVSPEIHLPVQSGSDRILRAMGRNYSRSEYSTIAGKLRRAVGALKLSTDFIVGFPGETEEDFSQTLSLAEELNFSMAYCFKYSPRAGTASAGLEDLGDAAKEERLGRLLQKLNDLQKSACLSAG